MTKKERKKNCIWCLFEEWQSGSVKLKWEITMTKPNNRKQKREMWTETAPAQVLYGEMLLGVDE